MWDIIVFTKDGGIEKMNRDGKDKFIDGWFFVIFWLLFVNENVNVVLKVMIKNLMLVINVYYFFGFFFVEDF